MILSPVFWFRESFQHITYFVGRPFLFLISFLASSQSLSGSWICDVSWQHFQKISIGCQLVVSRRLLFQQKKQRWRCDYALLETNTAPENWWLYDSIVSFWDGIFLGAMLVSGRVVREAFATLSIHQRQCKVGFHGSEESFRDSKESQELGHWLCVFPVLLHCMYCM